MTGSTDASHQIETGAKIALSGDGPGGAAENAESAAPNVALTHFASRVAHDFNNLLTGILGNLELLQLRAARNNLPGLDSYLDGANSAGTRAVAFASRLMTYSGRGASPASLVIVDKTLARFADRAACSLAAGDAAVYCDPAQLELAVAELVANAKAAGSTVSISSAVAGQTITIIVRDTGHGMEPDILARAREPFFTTATNGTGRGLGLPIVARVLRDLNGDMDITAQEGAGCTVTLSFPAV